MSEVVREATAWEASLLDFRQRKDEHFRAGHGPIEAGALEGFSGLSYYPPAPEWRFSLPLEAAPAGDEFQFDTSSGEPRFMELLGQVSVPLPGGAASPLLVFGALGQEDRRSVFIPFRDLTSGSETYGAGRYLEAPIRSNAAGQVVEVDFNRAYHPYCAYNEGWTCPLPPPQNRLAVAVRAGEKLDQGG